MSVRLLQFDDETQTYSLVDEETTHDAWYIRGREITTDEPNDQDVPTWDEASQKVVWAPGGGGTVKYRGYFPMGW